VSPEEIDAAVRTAEAKREASYPSKDKKSEEDADDPEGPSPKRRVTRSQMKKKSASPTKHVADSQPVDSNSNVNEWIPETHLKKGPQGRRKR